MGTLIGISLQLERVDLGKITQPTLSPLDRLVKLNVLFPQLLELLDQECPLGSLILLNLLLGFLDVFHLSQELGVELLILFLLLI